MPQKSKSLTRRLSATASVAVALFATAVGAATTASAATPSPATVATPAIMPPASSGRSTDHYVETSSGVHSTTVTSAPGFVALASGNVPFDYYTNFYTYINGRDMVSSNGTFCNYYEGTNNPGNQTVLQIKLFRGNVADGGYVNYPLGQALGKYVYCWRGRSTTATYHFYYFLPAPNGIAVVGNGSVTQG